jgi:hypothetical protein
MIPFHSSSVGRAWRNEGRCAGPVRSVVSTNRRVAFPNKPELYRGRFGPFPTMDWALLLEASVDGNHFFRWRADRVLTAPDLDYSNLFEPCDEDRAHPEIERKKSALPRKYLCQINNASSSAELGRKSHGHKERKNRSATAKSRAPSSGRPPPASTLPSSHGTALSLEERRTPFAGAFRERPSCGLFNAEDEVPEDDDDEGGRPPARLLLLLLQAARVECWWVTRPNREWTTTTTTTWKPTTRKPRQDPDSNPPDVEEEAGEDF